MIVHSQNLEGVGAVSDFLPTTERRLSDVKFPMVLILFGFFEVLYRLLSCAGP